MNSFAGMGLGRPSDRHTHLPGDSNNKKVFIGVAAVLVAFAVGLWALHAQWAGRHIRECGFDSLGLPYAVVRDNTIGAAKHEDIWVQFNYDHRWHESREPAFSRVSLPTLFGHAIGGVTTVVHGTSPKREPNGRQVYCTLGGSGANDYN